MMLASANGAEIYYTNRIFKAVEFGNQIRPADMLNAESKKLTNIVKGLAVQLDMTNTYAIEKQVALPVCYGSAEEAWNAALVYNNGTPSNYPGQIFDNVGWVRGTKSHKGEWGAYLWVLQNRIAFKSSETNLWVSPSNGFPVAITKVMVGSLGDYGPMEAVVDIGPHLAAATNNFPGANQSESREFYVDITNVFYQLSIPDIWVTPLYAVRGFGGSNVDYSVTGTNIPNGVTWLLTPDGLTSGAVIQVSNDWHYASVTPGNVATNYKIRVTSVDNTNFYVEVNLYVCDVESIEASCPIATNSPQFFEGGKTNFGDPCSATETGQTLIVYYDAVVNASYQVQDFDVTLKANVLPTSITASQLSESWAKVEGPTSGSLNRTDTFEVKYQNPKVGGLYKFEFDLGLSGCAKSGANVDLPLAGADMTTWLDTETKAVGAWATAHKAATQLANDSPVPFVTRYAVYQTWCSISGSFFDYVFDPVDAQQHAPCRRFQPTIGPNGQYGYVTVNGVVVHGSKINNMMWALFGRYWGWSETSLRLGAHLNQLARTNRIDGATSQNAIGFGDDIHDNPSANITTILTPANLRTLQDPNALIEEKLWPSPDAADTGNSTFTRPTLPTTP